MDGAVFVGGNGEGRLVDHGFQDALLNGEGVLVVHLGHFGVVVGGQTQNLKPRVAAGERDHELFVGGKHDDVIGHFADNVPEQAGAEHDAAALPNIGLQAGADAGLHIVARQGQHVVALQQQPLQRGNGAFCGDGAGGGVHGKLQQRLFAGKLQHGTSSFHFRKNSAHILCAQNIN